jgi:hypothetical protein
MAEKWGHKIRAHVLLATRGKPVHHGLMTLRYGFRIVLFSIVALTGCSTTRTKQARADSETVLVTYHVKNGKEKEFQQLLGDAWQIYRRDDLVFAEPHVVVQDSEGEGKPRFIEIFTWVSRSTPEHAPESVMAIWKQEEALCEKRGGHYGIEPGEAQLLVK